MCGLDVWFAQLYLGVCPRLLYFFSVLWKYGYVRARRTFHDCRPVQSRAVAVQGRYLQDQLVLNMFWDLSSPLPKTVII
ncbi:hypothetical protein Taro_004387 [Colocasia esculenta]|uniref:Uncharacterized protein n=1 Tax=Colocasia esculenta TaxID=4460 RepID=A0A843TJX6_COLES|nr:hypothetical protein [Colocasia esculenta]